LMGSIRVSSGGNFEGWSTSGSTKLTATGAGVGSGAFGAVSTITGWPGLAGGGASGDFPTGGVGLLGAGTSASFFATSTALTFSTGLVSDGVCRASFGFGESGFVASACLPEDPVLPSSVIFQDTPL
jgi:hypothetical protein